MGVWLGVMVLGKWRRLLTVDPGLSSQSYMILEMEGEKGFEGMGYTVSQSYGKIDMIHKYDLRQTTSKR